jgi:L-2-hydroxyglutarate oxidase
VIGGGIVGLGVARELLRRNPDLELAVLERAPVIATGQTGHTSGVIHASSTPTAPSTGSRRARRAS